jgi:glucose-1-phosphate adenylyltransferase
MMTSMSPTLPRVALTRTVALLLAGSRGGELHELTDRTCTPAIPLFATRKGPLRLVDFAMASIVRSGLPRLIVATDYQPDTLEAHLEHRWAPLFPGGGLVVRNGNKVRFGGGYAGSADAAAASRSIIDDMDPTELVVLSGDHIYQMDYSAMIAAHRASGAVATVAVHRMSLAEAPTFGLVGCASDGRIIDLSDRPARPANEPDRMRTALVSIGVYVFDWRWLAARLPTERSALDFQQDIIPGAVAEGGVAAYCRPASPGQSAPYWRNVSTLDSLRRVLLDFAGSHPCTVPVLPGPLFRLGLTAETSTCPILRPDPALVDSIALPGTHVLPGARLRCAIVAPGTLVPADLVVGVDPEEDAHWFRRTDEGTVLITNAMLARRSGQVYPMLRGPLRRAFDLPLLAV